MTALLAALIRERRRRWFLLLVLGVLFSLVSRPLLLELSLLVGMSAFLSISEGLSAWVTESRSDRLAYYSAWGISQREVRIDLSLAAGLPVAFIFGLIFLFHPLIDRAGVAAVAITITITLGLWLATASWRLVVARPSLVLLLPMIFAGTAALLAWFLTHGAAAAPWRL